MSDLLSYHKPAIEKNALLSLTLGGLQQWINVFDTSHFHDIRCKGMFLEIKKQHSETGKFDMDNISRQSLRDFYIDLCECETKAGMEYYFKILDHAKQVRDMAKAYIEQFQDPDSMDCVNEFKSKILSLESGDTSTHFPLAELSGRAGDRWQKTESDNRKVYSLGIPLIGEFLHVRAGNLVYVVAPPKTGKTWFVLNIALHLAKRNRVLFISAEMHPDDLYTRACSRILGKDFTSLDFANNKNNQLLSDWAKGVDRVNNHSLDVVKARGINLGKLISVCMGAIHRKVDVIVIDYFQRIRHKAESQRVAMMEVSREIANMAGEHETLFVVAVQAGRAARQAERTQAYHAAETSAIEQDADVIIALTAKESEEFMADKELLVNVTQRNGLCGNASLNFNLSTGVLSEQSQY